MKDSAFKTTEEGEPLSIRIRLGSTELLPVASITIVEDKNCSYIPIIYSFINMLNPLRVIFLALFRQDLIADSFTIAKLISILLAVYH